MLNDVNNKKVPQLCYYGLCMVEETMKLTDTERHVQNAQFRRWTYLFLGWAQIYFVWTRNQK